MDNSKSYFRSTDETASYLIMVKKMIQENRFNELEKTRVCAFDIDGVMNYYPQCWLDYITKETGIMYADLNVAKSRIGYADYKRLKKKYRESDFKRNLPVREGISQLTHWLHDNGWVVVVLTSRPFEQHHNLQKDTFYWLHKNNIYFDKLMSGRDKHAKVCFEEPHLKFMVEDNAYYANLVGRWGYKVYVTNNIYNINQSLVDGCERIDSLAQLKEKIMGDFGGNTKTA